MGNGVKWKFVKKFINESRVSEGKSNLAIGSTKYFRWNEMDIKGLEWKVELRAIKNP